MSNVLENIKTRRSVRSFRSEMVPKELIEKIVEAGTYAPSAMNLQSPIIIAITNKEVRDKISKVNAEIMGTTSDPFYGAPAILIVLAKKDVKNRVYDGSLVMENLMLAAHELGLGTCWVHRAKEEFERPEGQEILRSLGITEEYEGVGNCALGYIDGQYPQAPVKKELGILYRVRNEQGGCMEYYIRELKREEIPLLEDFLYEAIFQPDESNLAPRSILTKPELQVYIQNFGEDKNDHCLCAEVAGNVVGAVWVRNIMGYGNVDGMTPEFAISLNKAYRGHGIGTALMQEMLAYLKKAGYTKASLAVQKANYAVKMYKKVGFRIVEEKDEEYLMIHDLK